MNSKQSSQLPERALGWPGCGRDTIYPAPREARHRANKNGRPAKFRDENETPLLPSLRLRQDDPVGRELVARVGPLRRRARLMCLAVLANFKVDPDAALFYSRDRNFYSAPPTRRYYPLYYTYRATVSAVAALVEAGFVGDLRTLPSPRATKRSRLRATPLLKSLLEHIPRQAIEHVENELIVLRRRGDKKLIDYADTDQTRAMRADVQAQNAFLRQFVVRLDGVHDVAIFEGRRYDLFFRPYYRVFNGDFEHGGRWYGPVWQNLPKDVRLHLTIDGEATCELDFPFCHPRLLGASGGLQLPFDDPGFDFYRLPAFERVEVKSAVKILLNAPSRRSARGALQLDLQKLGIADAASRAKSLCKAVPAARPELAPYWGTGIGLRLQRIDADICTRVQAELRVRGIPALSIHDGFIVPVSARRSLQLAMDAAMQEACDYLRTHPILIGS